MKYGRVTENVLQWLEAIVGSEDVLHTKEAIADYAHDESSVEPHYPDAVVRPEDAEEVSKVLVMANQERIPVTPRGAGTGLCGGAVPIYGGILLTLEKMKQVPEKGLTHNWSHYLGDSLGQGSQSGAQTSRQNHRLHLYLTLYFSCRYI